jgi:hypothetical protein
MSRAATALRLAAAPTFAVLALLNGGAGTEMLCLHGASPLDSMRLMYGLMCVFHLGPWFRVIAQRRSGGRCSG